MIKSHQREMEEALGFSLGLHARHRASAAEQAVLNDLAAAFLVAYPQRATPLAFVDLRRRHCKKSSEKAGEVALWRILKALGRFLKFAHPPIPPTGVKWKLVTSSGRARSAWLEAEFEPLPAITALPFQRQRARRAAREGITPIWNGEMLHLRFKAAERPMIDDKPMVENVRVIARHLSGKLLGLRFEPSAEKGWKFSRHEARQEEFERLRDSFWAAAVAERKELSPRMWNGRTWCLAGFRKDEGNSFTLVLRRTRYADALFVATHWKKELPATLAQGQRRVTFADHCKTGTAVLRAYQSSPPVSLVRVGVIVWLSQTNNFLCTTFGTAAKRGLAGQGLCYSVATPEEKAKPKLPDQICRRLMEDIGFAIEPTDYRPLAFVQDAGPDGELERPWVFAVVETNKTFAQMEEIFEARRYHQFATKIVSVPAVELVRACSERDFDRYERSLLIAAVLFFASKGAAEIAT